MNLILLRVKETIFTLIVDLPTAYDQFWFSKQCYLLDGQITFSYFGIGLRNQPKIPKNQIGPEDRSNDDFYAVDSEIE